MKHDKAEKVQRGPDEWFKQAEYDMKTAKAMFDAADDERVPQTKDGKAAPQK